MYDKIPEYEMAGRQVVEKRAAGFIIFKTIKDHVEYLLLKASYGDHHWTPPKGHVDPGENDFQTALRETEEEAGFYESDLKITDFKKTLKYDVKGKPKTVIYWLAELKNSAKSVTLSSEHEAFQWATLEAACSLANFPDMQAVLKECDQYIKNNILEKFH